MKRLLASIALMATGIVCAGPAPYRLTVNSRAQTAPPVIAYAGNETVYRVSYTDGDTASAIGAGEVPFFAWATNNAAAVNSTSSYAIVAGTTGTVDFTFSPSAVNFAPGRYIYETGVKASNGNNRVYRQGTFQIYGSPIGSGVAAVTWTTNVNWAEIAWQNLPTWLSTPAVTPAQTSGWVTASHDGFLTNETDAAALNALATNRVTRWYDPELSSRWAEWDGGTNIVIYKAEVSGTNLIVTLSDGFKETVTGTRPAWTNNVWPFTDATGLWRADGDEEAGDFNIEWGEQPTPNPAMWAAVYTGYPVVILPTLNAQGTATVSIASFNLTTNVEWRYVLPTNAIPPELANLDNLQGWLNNLYAGKTAFDGHVTGGAHTNVTLAGTVTIGGVARTDWPTGTPGAITNGQAGALLNGLVASNNLYLSGSLTPVSGNLSLTMLAANGIVIGAGVAAQGGISISRFGGNAGFGSVAVGGASDASGAYAFSLGDSCTASGERALAMGYNAVAAGVNAIAYGQSVRAPGAHSQTFGYGPDQANPLTNGIAGSIAIGANSDMPSMRVMPSAGVGTVADVIFYSGASAPRFSVFDPGSNCYWRVTASNGLFYASDTNGVRQFKFVTEAP